MYPLVIVGFPIDDPNSMKMTWVDNEDEEKKAMVGLDHKKTIRFTKNMTLTVNSKGK